MENQPTFTVELSSLEGICIIKISGHLDAFTTPVLEEAIADQVKQQIYKLIIDFSDLNYIGSAGLGVFMMFIEEIRNNHGDIKFAAMKSHVFTVFDLLGFPMLYTIVDTVDNAIQLFREQK